MRILQVIHSMSPQSGGPAELVRRLSQTAEQAAIYETEVVTLDPPDCPFLQSEAVPIYAVGPGFGKYGYTSRLDQWFKKNLSRFDGVIVNGLWQYHGNATWRACRGRTPYIVYPHGMLDPWFKQAFPLKHLSKVLYWELVERRLLRDAMAVLFTSTLESELAWGTFPRSEWKSFTAPCGTVEPAGNRDLQVKEFYAACPEVSTRPFILFIGRIHEKKGCDLLIEAFAKSASTDPETHLVIAGPDEQGRKSGLLSLASRAGVGSRVHFPGMLQGDAKWGAFHSASVFALPSHQENFGIAVAEALACGTPVLISNKVNIWPDIVEDGVGLVDEDNLDGTARLLQRWRAMPESSRAEMAARCLSSFRRRYDMNQVPKVISGLFSKTLRGTQIGSP